MHAYAVVNVADRVASPVEDVELNRGLSFASLVGPSEGSVHMQIGHSILDAGGYIAGHLHPYEESFYILSGQVSLRLNGTDFALRAGDFGVVPLAVAHSWRNSSDEPVRWLRVRAPQPRNVDLVRDSTYLVPGYLLPEKSSPPPFGLPSLRHLGHFDDGQMPPPGPVAIRGTSNYGVRNISIRLMVDDTLGAKHHVMFVGQMDSSKEQVGSVPPPHYHAFEEMYYFISGTARGILEGVEHSIKPGTVAFAGVNATHGFIPTGDEPLRWIEVMAPRPPEQDSMMFVNQWNALGTAANEGRLIV